MAELITDLTELDVGNQLLAPTAEPTPNRENNLLLANSVGEELMTWRSVINAELNNDFRNRDNDEFLIEQLREVNGIITFFSDLVTQAPFPSFMTQFIQIYPRVHRLDLRLTRFFASTKIPLDQAIDRCNRKLAEINNLVNQLKAEKIELENRITEILLTSESSDARIVELQNQLDLVNQSLTECQNNQADLEALRSQLETANSEIEALQNRLAESERAVVASGEKSNALKYTLAFLAGGLSVFGYFKYIKK